MVAPAGPMFQVVTLSGNTLTMSSGTLFKGLEEPRS